MKRFVLLAAALLVSLSALAQEIPATSRIEKPQPPENFDAAVYPVLEQAAQVRARREAAALEVFKLVPELLSAGTMVSLYKNGDPNGIWGTYLDKCRDRRDQGEAIYKSHSKIETETLAVGDLEYTVKQLEGGVSKEQENALVEARLSEYGLSRSDLKENMTEEEAMAIASKMMEAQYGGINMKELDKYMNADGEVRQEMTTDALKERSDKTIRTETLNYITQAIAYKWQEITDVMLSIKEPFDNAFKVESITMYHDATAAAISREKSELLPLYLDLAALYDMGYAINRHAEYGMMEEVPFFPALEALGFAEGLSAHPQPDL